MQHPGGSQTGDGSPQGDLSDLLAPADVQFRPAPPPARPRRQQPPVAAPPPDPPPDPAGAAADLTRPGPPDPPAAPSEPAARDRPEPPSAGPSTSPTRLAAVVPDSPTGGVVTFGHWFQPVAGGVLPRPDPAEPGVAVVRAAPGSTVHAVTAGRVRRAPVTLVAGGLEIAGTDGTTLVLLAPAETAWVRDDEDVAAGEVLGALPTGGEPGDVELRVLVIGPDGLPRDAVDVLVGLPDPGELDLGPGLGTDPFVLDLEIAGAADPPGARP